jgi:Protein of unknown function (DUF3176)
MEPPPPQSSPLEQENISQIRRKPLSGSNTHLFRSVKKQPFTSTAYVSAISESDGSTNPPSEARERHQSMGAWWWFEILSYVASIVIMSIIIIILVHFDGRPQSAWKYDFNLNSLISLLATISRATMLIPVAEALSQCKWVWFSASAGANNGHRLADMDTFDYASRGSWASAVLFWRMKGM